MILKFALRNVLRNKRRSFLTVLTIFLAAALVGVAQGWLNGMTGVYTDNFTKYQTGHARVSTRGFIKREKFLPVDEVIYDSGEIIEKISRVPGVRAVRERIRFGILLGNKDATSEAMGMGIDLKDNEFGLGKKLVSGKMADSGIYIGEKLARKINVKVGDDLLIATRTSEGGLNGIKLPVRGIFKFRMLFDKKFFFISLADAKKLLKIHNGSTEIFVYGEDISQADDIKGDIQAVLGPGLAVETYREQMGEFMDTLEASKSIYAFIEMLILFLASFVIVNTMMMAIFERMREIGTMKALGMTDREIFINFTLEGAILGTAGGIIGAVIGFLVIFFLSEKGIDFTSQLENIDMPFEYILRPRIGLGDLIPAVLMSIIVPSLAAMIPARYARRLMPGEALRR